MLGETPQEAGRRFEREFSEQTGIPLQPGSGNQFTARMDAQGSGVTYTLKATRDERYPWGDMLAALRECEEYVLGPDGTGGESALALRVDSQGEPRDYVFMTLDAFCALLAEQRSIMRENKTVERRRRAGETVLERKVREMGEDTSL